MVESTTSGIRRPTFVRRGVQVMSGKTDGPNTPDAMASSGTSERVFAWFQPRLDVLTGRIAGIEVLSREQGPQPWLEHRRVTHWRETLRHSEHGIAAAAIALRGLSENGHGHLAVSVTVPWNWMTDARAVTRAIRTVHDLNVAPSNLMLQISDDVALSDMATAIRSINRLTRCGFEISLANFGAAVHTHHYLRCLPITAVGIDATIVASRHRSWRDAIILQSLIGMVRQMHIKVTLDGISDAADVDFAIEVEASMMQGDFISPPTQIDLLLPLLNTTNRLSAGFSPRQRRP